MKARLPMIAAMLLAQVAVANAQDQGAAQTQIVAPNTQPDDAAKPVTPKAAEPGTVGTGSRTIGPEGSRNDPHTPGGKDAPIPDPTRPTMAPTQQR